jgi:hypothetical protein
VVAHLVPYLGLWALGRAGRCAAVLAGLLALTAGLRAWRLARVRRLPALLFEPPDPSLATTMDLGSARR